MMSGMKMCTGHMVAYWLMWIGAVNWGLVGLGGFFGGNWNVVHMLLGAWPQLEWIVYILVGLSAVFMLFKESCSMCKAEMKKM
jgi:uncharacterized membrane protein YuzA (DUF378 family)